MTNPVITNEPILWDSTQIHSPDGLTPLGLYDSDAQFIQDAPRVADWCAKKLGWPVVSVELSDMNMFAAFEEAITEYSSQVNQFNIREYMLTLQGMQTGSSFTQKYVGGTPLPNLIRISRQYGTEALVGGDIELKRGSVPVTQSVQTYDLTQLVGNAFESGNYIEIRRVFYDNSPAIARYFDPYAGAGIGLQNLMTEFGFDGFSPAVSFVMLPAFEDLLRIQAIQFNDMIRKSQYTFQVVNNKLKIFPIPTNTFNLFFEYYVTNDKFASNVDLSHGLVSDYSNVPYTNILYSNINDVGKMWIRRYTLCLVKEILGNIRSKYKMLPIPNNEVTLDGETLRTEAIQEKEILMKELRESLEESGKQAQMKKQKENEENMQEIFNKIPLLIYSL